MWIWEKYKGEMGVRGGEEKGGEDWGGEKWGSEERNDGDGELCVEGGVWGDWGDYGGGGYWGWGWE